MVPCCPRRRSPPGPSAGPRGPPPRRPRTASTPPVRRLGSPPPPPFPTAAAPRFIAGCSRPRAGEHRANPPGPSPRHSGDAALPRLRRILPELRRRRPRRLLPLRRSASSSPAVSVRAPASRPA
nr:serine/arginine repetitive matrix protein 1-like [Aegilops tauschii subsp. strangulata]